MGGLKNMYLILHCLHRHLLPATYPELSPHTRACMLILLECCSASDENLFVRSHKKPKQAKPRKSNQALFLRLDFNINAQINKSTAWEGDKCVYLYEGIYLFMQKYKYTCFVANILFSVITRCCKRDLLFKKKTRAIKKVAIIRFPPRKKKDRRKEVQDNVQKHNGYFDESSSSTSLNRTNKLKTFFSLTIHAWKTHVPWNFSLFVYIYSDNIKSA